MSVNGRVIRSTAGVLHGAFRPFAPGVELAPFVDALLWSWNEAERRWDPIHHPFTSPAGELEGDPGSWRARAYDVVLDGWELGGGSIRINRTDVQQRVFIEDFPNTILYVDVVKPGPPGAPVLWERVFIADTTPPEERKGAAAKADGPLITTAKKAIATSEPSNAWISIARSGVRRTSEPSRCDVNVTPSSSTRRRCASEKTWKPP